MKAYTNHQDGLLEEKLPSIKKRFIDQDPQLQGEALGIFTSLETQNIKSRMISSKVSSSCTRVRNPKKSKKFLFENYSKMSMRVANLCMIELLKSFYEKAKEMRKGNEIKQAFARSNLYQQLHVQFQFNEKQIQELVKVLELKTNISEIKNIKELIQMFIQSDAFYYTNPAFCSSH